MADEIVHEFALDMISAYLALPIVKQVLANGTDATLIYVVYSVIENRFCYIRREKDAGKDGGKDGRKDGEKGGYKPVQNIHRGIFILMLLFAAADAGLYSYAQVYTTSNDAEKTEAINISNWYRNFHVSYITVYCAVILEMFACAVFISKQSRPKQTRVS
jgi:hypothetical protein